MFVAVRDFVRDRGHNRNRRTELVEPPARLCRNRRFDRGKSVFDISAMNTTGL